MDKKIKLSKKGEDGYTNTTIRIKDSVLNELNDIAAKTNRSRNEVINLFLEFSVNNWELEEK